MQVDFVRLDMNKLEDRTQLGDMFAQVMKTDITNRLRVVAETDEEEIIAVD